MSSNFQIGIIVAFIIFAVVAVGIFAGIIPIGQGKPENNASGTVIVWGTIPKRYLNESISEFSMLNRDVRIEYEEKKESTFDEELIDALASGKGPDAIIYEGADLWRYKDKLVHVPFESYPIRKFQDSFVEGAKIFLDTDGVVGFPFLVDPMVMYYNRDLLTREGMPFPPTTWTEMSDAVPKLTKKSIDLSIDQSTVAFGTFDNITHAKDVMALLLLGVGNPITKKADTVGLVSTLTDRSSDDASIEAENAMNFYMAFSNPVKDAYSWNRALPESKESFISGTLAFYFGFASELPEIRSVNPNLNFDVAQIPHGAISGLLPTTLGHFYATSVTNASKNKISAVVVASQFSDVAFQKSFIEKNQTTLTVPPIRLDQIAKKPTDPYLSIFYQAALLARTWIDPDKEETTAIFKDMVSDISSGALSVSQSVTKAHSRLSQLISKTLQ